ncbi:ComEA family DNA-binding protein [Actinomycetospora cinnamomea]|uniref:Competence protein ComEA n=1 Tax=Actinomycetospora cinnamomea TaxID=663609 RepID=A0A2U1EYI2_9PSEU|nr:ComEA family DNA-binding protein [Actinomycetospora cinnamomea]PVZ04995.1 competence protein ComEA [Actinomycetospora cinnamomea]
MFRSTASTAPDVPADRSRHRLRSLGATSAGAPRSDRAPARSVGGTPWGGPGEVDLSPSGADGSTRVGWPGAPSGTPAARLRLPGTAGARSPAGAREAPPESDDPWWDDGDDDPDDVAAPRRGSAWDPSPRGDRARRWAERWLPASWAGARWNPGRTGALALAAVAAVAAVVAAVGVWADRPVPEPVPSLPLVAGAPAPPATAGPPSAAPVDAGPIVVSVSGKVHRPGLVRLAPGSRVGDAVDAAGGATPDADLTGLNLAARIADGEQVVVGVPTPAAAGAGAAGSGAAPTGGGAGGAPAPGGRVDLNTATLEQLDQLPGVGPVTAQRILEWRAQNGRFTAVEQLQEVSGIGEARLANLRDLVTV